MDIIASVLPEQFFLDASDECLVKFGVLVDSVLGARISSYLANPEANPAAVSRIKTTLGWWLSELALPTAVHEDEDIQALKHMNIEAAAYLTPSECQRYIPVLEKLLKLLPQIPPTIKPRTKEAFEDFLASCPPQYVRAFRANRALFYQPRERPRSTGTAIFQRRRNEYEIMLWGFKWRASVNTNNVILRF